MTQKVAFITGITGQDGAYLTEFRLEKGYKVHGLKRRSSLFNTDRIDHLYQDPHVENRNLILHYGDLTDSMNLTCIIQEVQPDEIYNLAAMSHVKVSFDAPEYTANADGIGTLRILEAVRLLGLTGKTRIYQASTSELYGLVQAVPQRETTPFYPRSPYAVAKLYGHWITVNYREAYRMHASNGILFNHESPIRGETFVTRKVTRAMSRIALGMQEKVYMGNLASKRDWGHAKDYIRAILAFGPHVSAFSVHQFSMFLRLTAERQTFNPLNVQTIIAPVVVLVFVISGYYSLISSFTITTVCLLWFNQTKFFLNS